MKVSDLVRYFGSKAAAGRAVGIGRASVDGWDRAGEIPIDRQCQFEVVTCGRLRADRSKLRVERCPPAGYLASGQVYGVNV